jgi:hypothetical protein
LALFISAQVVLVSVREQFVRHQLFTEAAQRQLPSQDPAMA